MNIMVIDQLFAFVMLQLFFHLVQLIDLKRYLW